LHQPEFTYKRRFAFILAIANHIAAVFMSNCFGIRYVSISKLLLSFTPESRPGAANPENAGLTVRGQKAVQPSGRLSTGLLIIGNVELLQRFTHHGFIVDQKD